MQDDRFGRLFAAQAQQPDVRDLVSLGQTMVADRFESQAPGDVENNLGVPAGYTYLGQFIDHDLTLDPNPSFVDQIDPGERRNARTPRFDLDSLYGSGPAASPGMYEPDGVRFTIGKNGAGEDDLPRQQGIARIGDHRNDENLITSQIHLAFLKYHNRVARDLSGAPRAFETVRTIVLWHYQWIVLHDFLPKIVGDDAVNAVLSSGSSSLFPGGFMPIEFTAAAYRCGHSMVRNGYTLNGQSGIVALFDPGQNRKAEPADLRGFRSRPRGRQIEWAHFFPFEGHQNPARRQPQFARAFDAFLAPALGRLPAGAAPLQGAPPGVTPAALAVLPVRTLLRGHQFRLPSGQDVARAMRTAPADILGEGAHPVRIGDGTARDAARLAQVFRKATPLWYYVLEEARALRRGRILGPVGGRIVAEVFIGLLRGDPSSYLRAEPRWSPRAGIHGAPRDGVFSMRDLLQHAEVPIAAGSKSTR